MNKYLPTENSIRLSKSLKPYSMLILGNIQVYKILKDLIKEEINPQLLRNMKKEISQLIY